MPHQNADSRRILVLYGSNDDWRHLRPCIRHHLRVLESSPQRHRILYHNVKNGIPAFLRRIHFDVAVLHNTLLCYRWSNRLTEYRAELQWLRNCASVKIAIPQDEYNWSEILDDWLDELGVSVICTNFDAKMRSALYPKMHRKARFLRCLTGYIDETAAAAYAPRIRPIAERPRDIVYRAAHLPFWYGGQGQLKHEVASIVAGRAQTLGLNCDISTRKEDTITSDAWYDFLGSSKTVIGCESGSSVLNRRGEVPAQVEEILKQNPALSFAEVSKLLPPGWADYRFYAVGPRHLEAIYTRTCQILVEGDYDGVLKPFRHYLPLRRDFGNLDEVLHMIKDHALLEATASRAYEEIYLSKRFRYTTFARLLDTAIARAPRRASKVPWPVLASVHPWTVSVSRGLLAFRTLDWANSLWSAVPEPVKNLCRPVTRRLRSLLRPAL